MLDAFIPLYAFREITNISRGFLERLGLKFLILDLDNTIAGYKEPSPPESVYKWVAELKESGMQFFIVSNSARKERVGTFSQALGVDEITKARKPSPDGIIHAMDAAGFTAGESAFIGDQVFTDMIAANRAGIVSIIVKPRRLTNPFHTLRYTLEAPFRAMCKNRFDYKFQNDFHQ